MARRGFFMNYDILKQKSVEASNFSYAPYSKFSVGAALLLKNGEIILGCNVENVSFGLCNCGERTAIFTAIANGHKGSDFVALAVYSPNANDYIAPCGACRQVLSEFVAGDFPVLLGNNKKEFKEVRFDYLMPNAFTDLN